MPKRTPEAQAAADWIDAMSPVDHLHALYDGPIPPEMLRAAEAEEAAQRRAARAERASRLNAETVMDLLQRIVDRRG